MAIAIQSSWQTMFNLNFLQICCGNRFNSLYQVYRPIVHLQLCHGAYHKIVTKFYSKSGSKFTPSHCSWKFSSGRDWQPDFELNYLSNTLNNYAYHLKQSCSPLIDLQIWCGDLGQNLLCLEVTRSQRWAQYTEIRLSQKSSNVTLLQISPKSNIWLTSPHICEPNDLRYLFNLVFAL